jgi:hypothetical protein
MESQHSLQEEADEQWVPERDDNFKVCCIGHPIDGLLHASIALPSACKRSGGACEVVALAT